MTRYEEWVHHPLDPLDPLEIERACMAVFATNEVGTRPRIVWSALEEPSKADLARWTNGESLARLARVSLVDRASAALFEAVIDVDANTVLSLHQIPGRHASILDEEWTEAAQVLSNDKVVDALARRGVNDLSQVEVEPWPAGNFDTELDRKGLRLARCVFFLRAVDGDTDWARPIDQLVVIADRSTGEVLLIEEGESLRPVRDPGRLDSTANGARPDLRALHIAQPDGPSFILEDNELTWQRWRMRIGMHPIDGLLLHQVAYDDPTTGETRSIIHRASMAEMAVPYGDPSISNYWRHVFDAGEVGMGAKASSLTLGCDCLGEIRYLDAHMAEPDGTAKTITNAVCIHEEDDGVLWRHLDAKAGVSHVRRSRRLQVSSWSNLGNYDYGFYWNFYLDGSIEVEVKLTGVPLAMTSPAKPSRHLEPLAEGLVGPVHQHLFCFRLDLDIDGIDNVVQEIDVVSDPPGDGNLHGNAFGPVVSTLRWEHEAQRCVSAERSRRWRFSNPRKMNAYGHPVSYELLPTRPCPPVLSAADSPTGRRLSFARNHLWVTPFSSSELHPAGDYPNQSIGDDGLAAWTKADRSIDDTDLVAWFTCGVTHLARPEDWPVMPADKIGFHLKPVGFFDRNPAMDVPPQEEIVGQSDHCGST